MNCSIDHPSSLLCNSWPHRLAVGLVCITFPLVWVGGLVTTYDAGMSVPDWPSTFGYNLFLYPISTWLAAPWDLFIEHGHRLLASLAGFMTLALAASTWRFDPRLWVRLYMLICCALVIAQGVIGGLRVLWNETLLARIHGCVGPLFFVATVVAAVITSRWWHDVAPVAATAAELGFVRLTWVTAGVAYLQIVIGAHLRHVPASWSPGLFRMVVLGHLLFALVLLGHVGALLWRGTRTSTIGSLPHLLRPLQFLAGLTIGQLVIGACVWRLKYQLPDWIPQPNWLSGYTVVAESLLPSLTVTLHVAVGSLIAAAAAILAVRSSRVYCPAMPARLSSAGRLEVLL